MIVRCQIIRSDRGYEGVILDESGAEVYYTGFQGCAEDADGLMELAILRYGWTAVPWDSQEDQP